MYTAQAILDQATAYADGLLSASEFRLWLIDAVLNISKDDLNLLAWYLAGLKP